MGTTVTSGVLAVFERLCRTKCQVRQVILVSGFSTGSRSSVQTGGSSSFGFEFVANSAAGVSGRNLNLTVSVGALCGPCIGRGSSNAERVRPTANRRCTFGHSGHASVPCGVSRRSLTCGLFATTKFR